MRFMILVKATKDSEAGVMPDEGLMATMADEVRQLFELEDFAPGEAVERFKEMGVGTR